jgi:hypothetical protein
MRLLINEVGGAKPRFKISDEPDFALDDKNIANDVIAPKVTKLHDRAVLQTDVDGTYFVI